MKKVIFTYNDIQVIDKERNALEELEEIERQEYYNSIKKDCLRQERQRERQLKRNPLLRLKALCGL